MTFSISSINEKVYTSRLYIPFDFAFSSHWLSKWVKLICIDFHKISLIFVQFHWSSLIFIEFHWILLNLIEFNCIPLSFIDFNDFPCVSMILIECQWFSLNFNDFHTFYMNSYCFWICTHIFAHCIDAATMRFAMARPRALREAGRITYIHSKIIYIATQLHTRVFNRLPNFQFFT